MAIAIIGYDPLAMYLLRAFGRRRAVVIVALACLLAPILPVTGAGAQPASGSQPTRRDIEVRDELIATQESLLNTYRCLFGVDTHIVPGGCTDNQPVDQPARATTFVGTPSQRELEVRDELIATQESLLNTYRCLFGVDTHIVPGGCTDSPSATPVPANPYTTIATSFYHSCGVRADQTLTCWGSNAQGEADAPSGKFTAVATGGGGHRNEFQGGHSCAIRIDHTVACWGYNVDGQADPPSGQFIAIAAGSATTSSGGWSTGFSCGIRIDRTIACWGFNGISWGLEQRTAGQADPPSGQFTAIAAGGGGSLGGSLSGNGHSCAIRLDHTIACWGSNSRGQANPPSGQFTAIAAGGDHSCAIRLDHTIACWGSNSRGQANPPSGQFTAITSASDHSCGIRTDHTVACWGNNWDGQADPPSGQFTAIAAGRAWDGGDSPDGGYTCGIKIDHTVACWGNHHEGWAYPTGWQFTAIFGACGIRTDRTVACGNTTPISGQFTTIDGRGFGLHLSHWCGIRADRTVACWGRNLSSVGTPDPPSGQFVAIAAHGYTFYSLWCGIKTDQTIACWGDDRNKSGQADPPSGQFIAIALNDGTNFGARSQACGIRTDRTVACWDAKDENSVYFVDWADPPDGQFTAIANSTSAICGIRTDRTVACWGNIGAEAVPDGQFTAIATLSGNVWCGIRTDQTIACWDRDGEEAVPEGQFTAIADGGNRSWCGIETDQAIACWDRAYSGTASKWEAPGGRFTAIETLGGDSWCGIRTDRTIACWGTFRSGW